MRDIVVHTKVRWIFALLLECNALAELPPFAQADLDFQTAQRLIGSGDYVEALRLLNNVTKLKAEHEFELPEPYWLTLAQVNFVLNEFDQAIDSTQRYIREHGREGRSYESVLHLLVQIEQVRKIRELELCSIPEPLRLVQCEREPMVLSESPIAHDDFQCKDGVLDGFGTLSASFESKVRYRYIRISISSDSRRISRAGYIHDGQPTGTWTTVNSIGGFSFIDGLAMRETGTYVDGVKEGS